MRRFLSFLVIYAIVMLSLHVWLDGPVWTQNVEAASGIYYIDYVSGSNSNSGTSESTPWRSAPGMQQGAGCGGAPHSYSPVAGDQFIFKGNVTWPAACFVWTISNSGTSTAQDYYGTCGGQSTAPAVCGGATWPTSGWTRPKFDMAKSVPSGNNVILGIGRSYITFDNFEIANQGISGTTASTCGGAGATGSSQQAAFSFPVSGGSGAGLTVENSYIHDWMTTSTGGDSFLRYSAGSLYGVTIAANNIISGAGTTYGPSNTPITFGGAIEEVVGNNNSVAYGNVVHDTMAAMFNVHIDHDNEIYNVSSRHAALDACPHSQVIESDDANPNTIYNNLIYSNHGPSGQNVGVVIYECAATTIYNNVMYDNDVSGFNGDIIIGDAAFCANGGTGGTVNIYNNTIDCSNGVACFETDAKGTLSETVNLKNNIFITSGNPIFIQSSITTFNNTNNYRTTPSGMPTTEASTYGFNAAGKYAPASSDPNTVGQGTNLTSSCTGNLVALCKDTSGAPWFGGSYKTRPTGATAWDIGAYVFAGGTTGPPTVTFTSPSAGTVSGTQTLTVTCTPQGSATCTSVQFTIDGFPFGSAITSSPWTKSWDTTTAANANHVLGAAATDSNNRTNTAGTVAVTVSNSIPGCFVSTDNSTPPGPLSWTANQAIGTQTANFSATVTVTPNTANQDSVIALSENAMTGYSQGAALLRFNSNGDIDAWSDALGNYTWFGAPSSPITYTAGTAYNFTITPNFTGVNAGTYSISETSPSSIVIATNYEFRSTALIASLGFVNAVSDNDTPDTAKVCNFQVGSATSLTFSPVSLAFPNVNVGSNSTLSIGVTSAGGATTFTSVVSSDTTDFPITTNGCTSSQTSCSASVKFQPAAAQAYNATVTFTDSAGGSPQVYNVSGTGIPAASSATPSPTSINFGNVQLGGPPSTSGPAVVALANGPITFVSVTYSNPDFSSASNTCTGSVSAPSCQIVPQFTPSSLSNETATMTITDNAPSGGSTQTVALVGTGVNFPTPAPAVQFVWNGTMPLTIKGKAYSIPVTCTCTFATSTCDCQ